MKHLLVQMRKNSLNEQKNSSNEQKNSSNEPKKLQQFSTKLVYIQGQVRLRNFLGQPLQLGQEAERCAAIFWLAGTIVLLM